MIAILYLFISISFGISLSKFCVNTDLIYEKLSTKEFAKKVPNMLLIIPLGTTLGIMTSSFINYYLIYILQIINKSSQNNYDIGIILTCFILGIITSICILKTKRKKYNYNKKDIIIYSIISTIILFFVSFLMIFSFRMKGDNLLIGNGVAGDFAVHTAMTSSFGIGGNIPTQYMHFSGDGINWHFFFYFFAGILNYLGLKIDLAINIPSIITMCNSLILVRININFIFQK